MKKIAILFVLSLGHVSYSEATPDLEAMAKRVIELRQDVEILNEDYKNEKEDVVGKLKAYTVQRAELEIQIRGEDIRHRQLTEKIARIRQSVEETSVLSESLIPVFQEYSDRLGEYISSDSPVHRTARTTALFELRKDMETKSISSLKALQLLWALYEDERRLARETTISKNTISIDGEMKLATLAKVGSLFVFFQSEDGRVGLASATQGWGFQSFPQGGAKEQQALAFLDALKKQIRQGYFELPVTL